MGVTLEQCCICHACIHSDFIGYHVCNVCEKPICDYCSFPDCEETAEEEYEFCMKPEHALTCPDCKQNDDGKSKILKIINDIKKLTKSQKIKTLLDQIVSQLNF